MDVLIFKNFLSAAECAQLNEWVELGVKNKWLDKGLNQSADWTYNKRLTTRNYADRFDYPKVAYDVFDKITNFLDLQDLEKSVCGAGKDGIVVSYTLPDGDVYKHVDPKEGELEVLRCNIITKDAEEGGKLYIGGKYIDVKQGDLHCYLPSTIEHYVTKVKGNTPRILWMFGYQCATDRFNNIRNNYEANYKS